MRLATIPLSIALLGVNDYGLFIMIGSLVAWGGLADLGLAPGLINVVATADGRNDRQKIREVVSTALLAYGTASLCFMVFTIAITQSGVICDLFNINDSMEQEKTRHLVIICGLAFGIGILAKLGATICQALQMGHWPHIALGIGNATTLFLLLVAPSSGLGVANYALIVAVPPVIANCGLACGLYWATRGDLRPQFGAATWSALRELLCYAGPLSIYQACNVIILYSGNVLIGSAMGSAAVVEYSVPAAAYAISVTLANIAAQPFIASFAEAKSRKDTEWLVRWRFRLPMFTGLAVAAASGLLFCFGGTIIYLWTSGTVEPGWMLMGSLALYSTAKSVCNTMTSLLIGYGLVGTVAVGHLLAAVIGIGGAVGTIAIVGTPALPLALTAGHVAFLVAAKITFKQVGQPQCL